jgi:hypothetical protein
MAESRRSGGSDRLAHRLRALSNLPIIGDFEHREGRLEKSLDAKSTGLRVCFRLGAAFRAAEIDPEQHLFECRLRWPSSRRLLFDSAVTTRQTVWPL